MAKAKKIEPLYKPERVPKGGLSWEKRNVHWNATPEWIQNIILNYCYGTDTDPRKCTLYYVGKKYALIKFPGGAYWSGGNGNSYCSPWIDRFWHTKGDFCRHDASVEVWNCELDPPERYKDKPHGRATNAVIQGLIDDLIKREVKEGLVPK